MRRDAGDMKGCAMMRNIIPILAIAFALWIIMIAAGYGFIVCINELWIPLGRVVGWLNSFSSSLFGSTSMALFFFLAALLGAAVMFQSRENQSTRRAR
jgi:nitrate reductase NapE component